MSSKKINENRDKWDELIKAGEEKIERLKQTVKRFREYRDSDVPFVQGAEHQAVSLSSPDKAGVR